LWSMKLIPWLCWAVLHGCIIALAAPSRARLWTDPCAMESDWHVHCATFALLYRNPRPSQFGDKSRRQHGGNLSSSTLNKRCPVSIFRSL
jgi:hypothetical protein